MSDKVSPPMMVVIPDKKKVENSYAKEMKEKTHEIDPRPSFSINADILPAIKEWTTGGKYNLEIQVEQVGSRIQEYGDDKGKLVADFKICGIMIEPKEDKKSEDKEEYPKAMLKPKK